MWAIMTARVLRVTAAATASTAGTYVPSSTLTKTGHGLILDDGVDGRGKAGGNGDDFVARPDPPVLELRRPQCAEGYQVGRRTGIDQQGRIAIHPPGQFAFELLREPPRGEPEIQAGLDGQLQFLRRIRGPRNDRDLAGINGRGENAAWSTRRPGQGSGGEVPLNVTSTFSSQNRFSFPRLKRIRLKAVQTT